MTRIEMIEARQKALDEARALSEQITTDTTEGRAKELGDQHDAAMVVFDKYDEMIKRHDRMKEAEARTEQETRSQHDDRNEGNRPNGTQGAARESAGDQVASYDDAFFGYLRHGGDASALTGEMRQELISGQESFSGDERAQLSDPATAGGILIPTELQAGIITSMAINGPMYDDSFINAIPSSTGAPWPFPTINDLTGELDALDEGVEVVYDAGKAFVMGEAQLSAYMFDSKFIKIGRALLTDSRESVTALTTGLLGERAGRTANKELTTGDGIDGPQGIVTGSTLGHTTAAVGSIAPDDLIELEHSVNGAYRFSPKAAFQMNDNTLKGMRKWKNADGDYIWQPANLKTGAPSTFLGYKFRINPDLADIATGAEPIIFGDHSKYYVRKVGGLLLGVAKELFFPNLGLAVIIRFDGRVMDARALKKLAVQ